MADDIVTRLREFCQCDEGEFCTHCEAAHLLDAIDALHQPYQLGDGRTSEDCDECGDRWPCPTARLLHPEKGQ